MEQSSIETFVNNVVSTTAEMIGATAHVSTVSVVPAAAMPKHVAASYTAVSPRGGDIRWQRESAEVVQTFLSRRYLSMPERDQIRFLQKVRLELAILFHEALHSVGQPDYRSFQQDFVANLQNPGMRATLEGSNELIAQAFLPELIQRLNLAAIDPRISQVGTPDAGVYPGQVAAMFQIYSAVAEVTGNPIREVLLTAAKRESGQKVLIALVRASLATRGLENDRQAISRVANGILRELDACQEEFYQSLERGGSGDPTAEMRMLGTEHGKRAVGILAGVLRGDLERRARTAYELRPLSPTVGYRRAAPMACGMAL